MLCCYLRMGFSRLQFNRHEFVAWKNRSGTVCFKVLPLETGGSGENTGGTVVIVGHLVDGRRDFAAGSGESARGRG